MPVCHRRPLFTTDEEEVCENSACCLQCALTWLSSRSSRIVYFLKSNHNRNNFKVPIQLRENKRELTLFNYYIHVIQTLFDLLLSAVVETTLVSRSFMNLLQNFSVHIFSQACGNKCDNASDELISLWKRCNHRRQLLIGRYYSDTAV